MTSARRWARKVQGRAGRRIRSDPARQRAGSIAAGVVPSISVDGRRRSARRFGQRGGSTLPAVTGQFSGVASAGGTAKRFEIIAPSNRFRGMARLPATDNTRAAGLRKDIPERLTTARAGADRPNPGAIGQRFGKSPARHGRKHVSRSRCSSRGSATASARARRDCRSCPR